MNPYYDAEKLQLKMISFDEPNLSYEYNTLCFFATKDGRMFSASDSGCSCPIPFEDSYCGETTDEVILKMNPIGCVKDALEVFDSWNKDYNGRPHLAFDHRKKLSDWIKEIKRKT